MGVPVTVTIDSELLSQATELGLDVPQVVEQAVARRLAKKRAAREFYEENREAVDSYNAYVETHGAFGAEWRRW